MQVTLKSTRQLCIHVTIVLIRNVDSDMYLGLNSIFDVTGLEK